MPREESSHLKPSRSEELVAPDEQLKIAEQIRQHFEDGTPRRTIKPSRSDASDGLLLQTAPDSEIPEHRKFLELEACHELVLDGSGATPLSEEFVETDYYKELNLVDKTAHHTIGTGFIFMERNGAQSLNLEHPSGLIRTGSQGNPATNDWIPSPSVVSPATDGDKPHRSEP